MTDTNTSEHKIVSEVEMRFYDYINGNAGVFNTMLFETILHADFRNLRNLQVAFPEEAAIVHRYKTQSDYVKVLEQHIKDL